MNTQLWQQQLATWQYVHLALSKYVRYALYLTRVYQKR